MRLPAVFVLLPLVTAFHESIYYDADTILALLVRDHRTLTRSIPLVLRRAILDGSESAQRHSTRRSISPSGLLEHQLVAREAAKTSQTPSTASKSTSASSTNQLKSGSSSKRGSKASGTGSKQSSSGSKSSGRGSKSANGSRGTNGLKGSKGSSAGSKHGSQGTKGSHKGSHGSTKGDQKSLKGSSSKSPGSASTKEQQKLSNLFADWKPPQMSSKQTQRMKNEAGCSGATGTCGMAPPPLKLPPIPISM